MTTTQPTRTRALHRIPGALRLVALLLVAVFALGACSTASDSDVADDAAMDGAPAFSESDADGQFQEGAGDDSGGGQDPGGEAGSAADVGSLDSVAPEEGAMMVRTVRMEVLVEDVTAAVSRARAASVGAGGWVSSEEVTPGSDDRAGWATMVLRVPSEDLDAVITELGGLGEVTASHSRAENVAAEYRDVEARVSTLEAGTERLRDLISEAGGVEAIASLERELADREMELDALKARMQVLAEDVARSTVTLHLAEEREALAEIEPDTGFLAGLRSGWDAFTESGTMLLTALGALLPFLVLLSLLAVPVLVWRRRRRAASATGTVHHARSGGASLASGHDRRPAAAGDPDRS